MIEINFSSKCFMFSKISAKLNQFLWTNCKSYLIHGCGLKVVAIVSANILKWNSLKFVHKFDSEASVDVMELEKLQLQETDPLQLATMEQVQLTGADLLRDAASHLPTIRATYLQAMQTHPAVLQFSRFRNIV